MADESYHQQESLSGQDLMLLPSALLERLPKGPDDDPISQELKKLTSHAMTGTPKTTFPFSVNEYSMRLQELLYLLNEETELDEASREDIENELASLTLYMPLTADTWNFPEYQSRANDERRLTLLSLAKKRKQKRQDEELPESDDEESDVYPNNTLSKILIDNYAELLKFSSSYFNLSLAADITRFMVDVIYALQYWEVYHLLYLIPNFDYFLKLVSFDISQTPYGPIVRPPENYLEETMQCGLQFPFPYPFYNYSYHSFNSKSEQNKLARVTIEAYHGISLNPQRKKRKRVERPVKKLDSEDERIVDSDIPSIIAPENNLVFRSPEFVQQEIQRPFEETYAHEMVQFKDSPAAAEPAQQFQFQMHTFKPKVTVKERLFESLESPQILQDVKEEQSVADTRKDFRLPEYIEGNSRFELADTQSAPEEVVSKHSQLEESVAMHASASPEANLHENYVERRSTAQQENREVEEAHIVDSLTQTQQVYDIPTNPLEVPQPLPGQHVFNLKPGTGEEDVPRESNLMNDKPSDVSSSEGEVSTDDSDNDDDDSENDEYSDTDGRESGYERSEEESHPSQAMSESSLKKRKKRRRRRRRHSSTSHIDFDSYIREEDEEVASSKIYENPSEEISSAYSVSHDSSLPESARRALTHPQIVFVDDKYKKNKAGVIHQCHLTDPSTLDRCMKIFYGKNELLRHQEFVHATKKKIYKCIYCSRNGSKVQSYPRHDSLARHIRRKHGVTGKENKMAVNYAKDNVEVIDDPNSLITKQHSFDTPLPHPQYLNSDFTVKPGYTGFLSFSSKDRKRAPTSMKGKIIDVMELPPVKSKRDESEGEDITGEVGDGDDEAFDGGVDAESNPRKKGRPITGEPIVQTLRLTPATSSKKSEFIQHQVQRGPPAPPSASGYPGQLQGMHIPQQVSPLNHYQALPQRLSHPLHSGPGHGPGPGPSLEFQQLPQLGYLYPMPPHQMTQRLYQPPPVQHLGPQISTTQGSPNTAGGQPLYMPLQQQMRAPNVALPYYERSNEKEPEAFQKFRFIGDSPERDESGKWNKLPSIHSLNMGGAASSNNSPGLGIHQNPAPDSKGTQPFSKEPSRQ